MPPAFCAVKAARVLGFATRPVMTPGADLTAAAAAADAFEEMSIVGPDKTVLTYWARVPLPDPPKLL